MIAAGQDRVKVLLAAGHGWQSPQSDFCPPILEIHEIFLKIHEIDDSSQLGSSKGLFRAKISAAKATTGFLTSDL